MMRRVDTFFVVKTDLGYDGQIRQGKEVGLLYPAPHVLVTKIDFSDPESIYIPKRMRPISARCGLIRDSRINNNGVGIAIHAPNGDIAEHALLVAAAEIKNIIEDLGIVNYVVQTDENNEDRRIDTMQLEAKIASIKSIFIKLK